MVAVKNMVRVAFALLVLVLGTDAGSGGENGATGGPLDGLMGMLGGLFGQSTPGAASEPAANVQTTALSASEPECKTLAETASEVPELSTLVQALTAENGALLDAATNPDTEVTVFAPTNDAFAAALDALNVSLEDLVGNSELLETVLSYHVVPSVARAADLSDGMTLPTLQGEELTVGIDGETVTIEGVGSSAQVVTADVAACKSVVHVIDNVLLPIELP